MEEQEKTIINIVWGDDEIDTILQGYPPQGDWTVYSSQSMPDTEFHILRAHHAKEAYELLVKNVGRIDALVTDANYNADLVDGSSIPREERVVNGLSAVLGWWHNRAVVPAYDVEYYLLTQRIQSDLQELYARTTQDYEEAFVTPKRVFAKDNLTEMFQRIRRDILEKHSPAFAIRQKYQLALRGAEFLKDVGTDTTQKLTELLCALEGLKPFSEEKMGNVRLILERMFQRMCSCQMLPKNMERKFNNTVRYLRDGKCYHNPANRVEFIEMPMISLRPDKKDWLMPRAVGWSLNYVAEVSHELHHVIEGCQLDIKRFSAKHPQQFRSMACSLVYALVTVLEWYADLMVWYKAQAKANGGTVGPLYVEKSIAGEKMKIQYVYGKLSQKSSAVIYCGPYQLGLAPVDAKKYPKGASVYIEKAVDHAYASFPYRATSVKLADVPDAPEPEPSPDDVPPAV